MKAQRNAAPEDTLFKPPSFVGQPLSTRFQKAKAAGDWLENRLRAVHGLQSVQIIFFIFLAWILQDLVRRFLCFFLRVTLQIFCFFLFKKKIGDLTFFKFLFINFFMYYIFIKFLAFPKLLLDSPPPFTTHLTSFPLFKTNKWSGVGGRKSKQTN